MQLPSTCDDRRDCRCRRVGSGGAAGCRRRRVGRGRWGCRTREVRGHRSGEPTCGTWWGRGAGLRQAPDVLPGGAGGAGTGTYRARWGAGCRGDDGRGRGAAPGRWGRPARALPAAEQGAAQSTQRGEERDAARSGPCAPGAAAVRGVTRSQLTHQRRRLERLPLRDRRPREDREMPVETRTGRAAAAGDRRDPGPVAHCYLFHVTPHPYESTRPGQGNPISPSGPARIAATGFTFPIRGLTNTRRLLSESERFQGELSGGVRGRPRWAAVRPDGHGE
ncbi:hypothetical protein RKD26_005405 [Streptomyces calvus]